MICEPITKPVRARCRAHLAHVGSKPCCIPGCRAPANVHHLTHVQPKARGLKAGDQWTVPLCKEHHQGNRGVHAHGREADWWRMMGIDPLPIALRLWGESQAPKIKKSKVAA